MAIDVSHYREVHKILSTPEAHHLAELYLLRADLEAAHKTLRLCFEKFVVVEGMTESESTTIASSLFRDGILLFSACFSTKDPEKLHPMAVFGHLDDWEGFCQKILDVRDSFVAHNFGAFRQINIVVIAMDIDGKLVPAGFNDHSLRLAGWPESEQEKLLQYVEIALEYLNKHIQESERQLAEIVQTMTSEELTALQDADGFLVPEQGDFRSSRARFRQSGRGEHLPVPARRWIQTIEDVSEPHHLNPRREDPDEKAPPQQPEPTL